jgi:hypothetical protein
VGLFSSSGGEKREKESSSEISQDWLWPG